MAKKKDETKNNSDETTEATEGKATEIVANVEIEPKQQEEVCESAITKTFSEPTSLAHDGNLPLSASLYSSKEAKEAKETETRVITNWNDLIDQTKLVKDKETGATFIPLSELKRLGRLKGICRKEISHYTSEPCASNPKLRYATAVVTLVFFDGKTYSALASAGPENLDDIYVLYPESIAENRAYARALRDALDITICSVEEVTKRTIENIVSDPSSPISAAQISVIERLCANKGIEISQILKSGSRKVERVEDLKNTEAQKIILALNRGTVKNEN